MGAQFSKIRDKLMGCKEVRVLMLGLDAAGKTTILYKLKTDQEVTTIPTVGFNVETVQYKRTKFNIWDVGGQDKIRTLWRHYYSGTQALMFVVDSSDRARIGEARDELARIIKDRELKGVMVLVFANKMDLPRRMTKDEVWKEMWTEELKGTKFTVQDSCATTGVGIFEGLGWLADQYKPGSEKQGNDAQPKPPT